MLCEQEQFRECEARCHRTVYHFLVIVYRLILRELSSDAIHVHLKWYSLTRIDMHHFKYKKILGTATTINYSHLYSRNYHLVGEMNENNWKVTYQKGFSLHNTTNPHIRERGGSKNFGISSQFSAFQFTKLFIVVALFINPLVYRLISQ